MGNFVLGESIDLTLPIGKIKDKITIAKDAVIPSKGGHRVVVIVDGKAEPRSVELGAGFGDRIVVTKGIRAGELCYFSRTRWLAQRARCQYRWRSIVNALIRSAIVHPIGVLAVVLLMILFGVASLQTIPIQMTPDIDKPILQVRAGLALRLRMWNRRWFFG